MSQENEEALRPVYEEWERGNLRPDPDVYGPLQGRKPVRLEVFSSRDKALEAAGLRE